ncbi:TPA: RluA family pseudouridine synthase [Candidatus Saccharibacteria bacterium]|nr:MAG: ribosomal large subunit pseudouridine synthase, RluD subfamily protein, nonfunctional [Candidatus Saccharibacteria bacterium GW2011_GWA2_46_10]OGL35553.1 MAG: hypothetical protein A3F05_00470 [Candidatus Saccharibacteria bacterium RIFCSPHIGHO2_12_FULL_47_17]HCM51831.1 RluA family pseudouridine synthase [Candidatus Saccharibacteria bacterium]
MQKLTVSNKESGLRADIFVTKQKSRFSRASLKKLFDRGLVQINGHQIRSSYKLKTGDNIEIDTTQLTKKPPSMKLPIIYEDGDVLVIDKPSGILTHSKGVLNIEATVASFIKPKLNDRTFRGNRAGIVHRLDRGTSGVIITAKNQKKQRFLQKQFSARKVKKYYIAIVEGKPKEQAAIIDAPIARNPRRPQTFKVSARGRPARTSYRVLKTLQKDDKIYSLVEFEPETGRTHQIRVHATYIGHSIVGDPVYGKADGQLLLHAKTLEIKLPNGESKRFVAEVPTRFTEFVK